MEYRGYVVDIVFDDEAKVFHGRVKGIKDVVTFEATDAEGLEREFHTSVDEYLAFCEEMGRSPEKPFSGKVLLRISNEVHRNAWITAEKLGLSLNAFIASAVEEFVHRYRHESVTGVATGKHVVAEPDARGRNTGKASRGKR